MAPEIIGDILFSSVDFVLAIHALFQKCLNVLKIQRQRLDMFVNYYQAYNYIILKRMEQN